MPRALRFVGLLAALATGAATLAGCTAPALILTAAGIATAEDTLRALIVDPARADYWQVRLQPTDAITAAPRPPCFNESTRSDRDA